MNTAGNRRERQAQRGWRFAMTPPLSAAAGTLPTIATMIELTLRTTGASTRPAAASAGAPNQSLYVGGTQVSLQALVLIYVLGLTATMPPVFLRPEVGAVTISVANALLLGLFDLMTVAGACMQLFALYRIGRVGARLLAPSLAMPFLVFALIGSSPARSEAEVLTLLLASLGPAAAWAGLARRAHDDATTRGAEQESIASTLLEHTARGERARIARELHDVVAHHISMIAVQAETARLTTPGMPAAGARRLLEIGDTARAALTEMRRLLGILREDARANESDRLSTDQPTRAELRPQPGLQQLNELLDDARNASRTSIRLILSGSPVALDPGVELAAYRIIQEALTNARRHAPGAAVDVELHYTAETLRVRIRDNGPGPPLAPSLVLTAGHGMLGMQERAAAVGGRLHTSSAIAGGFLIEATLPAKADAEVIA